MNGTKKTAPEGGGLVELLKEVEHELTFLNGLVATDCPELVHIPEKLKITLDEAALCERVRGAIKVLDDSDNRLS